MKIAFEGECTAARVEEARDMLLRALDSGDPLELDFAAATRIDLAFCQVLHALRKSCREKGIQVTILHGSTSEVAAMAARCGMSELAEAFPA